MYFSYGNWYAWPVPEVVVTLSVFVLSPIDQSGGALAGSQLGAASLSLVVEMSFTLGGGERARGASHVVLGHRGADEQGIAELHEPLKYTAVSAVKTPKKNGRTHAVVDREEPPCALSSTTSSSTRGAVAELARGTGASDADRGAIEPRERENMGAGT